MTPGSPEKQEARSIRVLHAPLNYANQAYVLSQALRARGIDSHLLRYQWEGHAGANYGYGDERVAPISKEDWLGDMLRVMRDVTTEGFDIIHFWNRTLLWNRSSDVFNGFDLPFLRLAGLRLAYRFTGYELRRKSLELEVNPFTPYRYGFLSNFSEDDQKRYLDSVAPYIDEFVVQDPEMQTYCPQARIIPRALDLQQFSPVDEAPNERPLVVHVPSDRLLKGSEFVFKAVDTLKAEGFDFDFRLIENMPHAEAVAQYRKADVIVDQLLIGWYGVVSIEAMAMGKTAIAYIRDDLKGHFGKGMPLIDANPETIVSALREAIRDRDLRREIGKKARAFVEDVHDSRTIASTAANMYEAMVRAPSPRPIVPDFGYQLAQSPKFVRSLVAARLVNGLRAQNRELESKLAAVQDEKLGRQLAHWMKSIRALFIARAAGSIDETPATGVNSVPGLGPAPRPETADILERELSELIPRTQHYDLPALRYAALQYELLKPLLPALRYKARRYDELKRLYDRLFPGFWLRAALRRLGLSRVSAAGESRLPSVSTSKAEPLAQRPPSVT